MRGFLLSLMSAATCCPAAERINHEGRVLGEIPPVTSSILFNTPQADAVVSAMQIMPRDSAWNEDISTRPVLSNSDAMISRITADLLTGGSNRGSLFLFEEMNYALVPNSQPVQPIQFFQYPNESDLDGGTSPNGSYPIPANLPVETWPTGTGSQTLEQWQAATGGDRHTIIVMPGNGSPLGDLGHAEAEWQLARGQWREVLAQQQQPAPCRLDLGRCGGAADVSRAGALR